jgi:hypothetical protein
MKIEGIILAIDPGCSQSGYVIWDGSIIREKGIVDNSEMFSVLSKREYTLCLIEMIACYGMAVGKEVFDTCRFIGQLEYACPTDYELVYRKDVKLHHCNSIRAKDSNIIQVLKDRFPQGNKKNPGITYGVKSHIWQALAIAVMWTDQIELQKFQSDVIQMDLSKGAKELLKVL